MGEAMHTRVFGMPSQRARKRSTRLPALALVAITALSASVLAGASAVADETKPATVWGSGSPDFSMPTVKVGSNRPVASKAATNPTSDALVPWSRGQRERAKGGSGKANASAAAGDAAILSVVPEGQGDVPWHRYTSFAITDALTARIDYSTGNLMLTATDFDVAGVGQRLMLARTYNSLDAPWGRSPSAGGSSTSATCRSPPPRRFSTTPREQPSASPRTATAPSPHPRATRRT